MKYTTVTDLQTKGELKFLRGRYNILDCGVRTGKTYWAINNLRQFTRDGQLNRILFLTDTTALKTSIIEQYGEQCCEADEFWARSEGEWSIEAADKIGIMCYQALGMRALREDLEFLDTIDVICWDECDSVFDFAASAFAKARKYDFSRKSSTNEEILAMIQQYSSKNEYMPLVLLGTWERIINSQRILCVGLSATPERARAYYQSLVHAAYQGKIDAGFRAANDIYFKNILEHITQLAPVPGNAYWCFSPSIEHNKAIVECANQRGFHAIEIHSRNNTDKPLTPEQERVINCIEQLHIVPLEYDFVVITRAYERGIDIIDARFKNLIIDSYYQVDRIQAGRQLFPYQRHVKVLSGEVPADYLNRWLSVEECKELADYMAVPEFDTTSIQSRNVGRVMTWNKLQTILPEFGYNVKKARKRLNGAANATTAYYITGEWHDVEVVLDNDFMQLAAAKNTEEQQLPAVKYLTAPSLLLPIYPLSLFYIYIIA